MSRYKYSIGILLVFITSVLFYSFSSSKDEPKKPEDNRFTKVVLAQKLEEPMQFEILKDGRVLFVERKGKMKLYNPADGQVKVIANFNVSTKYVSKKGEVTEGEDGLQGVILDPNYDQNHWIYVYYSPAEGEPRNTLVRFKWDGGQLNMATKKVLLDVPVQREECCHVGGGMLFDAHGNLYLSTGDNTFSRSSDGFSPLDERPGESPRDAQKSSGNTNDLRGKILRIHPEPDGTYSIPMGNLFPKGMDKTKPEIYTMGNRNPWRLSVDTKTGYLYWGEVGPDGSVDSVGRGPRSYDEFNVAKKAGNFGWPYFNGNNQAYWDYDFATKTSGEKFVVEHPVNHSPNNTGLIDLPPAQSAMIYYPYAESKEFPELGSGGRSATGGPIYHRANFNNPKRPFPDYYEGKWLVTDWVRGWIMSITLDENGDYKSMERFLPDMNFRGAIDMDFGPDGDLYVLEYGNGYFKDNPEAELVRIEYNGGNRKPIVQATASKSAGAVPLKTQLSAEGTKDYDGDALKYEWKVTSKGSAPRIFKEANPTVTFSKPGIYKATLTVTDPSGAKNSKTVEVRAGNEPPVVDFNLLGSNRSFFFPDRKINYNVLVSDKEDGSLANKRILPSQVSVSINYLSEGYDLTEIAQSQRSVDASVQFAAAKGMIAKSDCKACHSLAAKSLGPAFVQVAKKYKGNANAVNKLAKKIITGGSGVWGDAMMPAHSSLPEKDAQSIVKYILSLAEPHQTIKSLPVKGSYITKVPNGESDKGSFLFRAAYTDKGKQSAPSQSSEDVVVLRNPTITISHADKVENLDFNNNRTRAVAQGSGSYASFNKIDLTGIKEIEFSTSSIPGDNSKKGAVIEVRIDSPTGKVIGKTTEIPFLTKENPYRLSKVKAKLQDVSGFHPVYFVFVNPEAAGTEKFVQIRDITFKDQITE
ncbi:PQQ-dependent sugar dehydrogenase [Rubrolithibacter danxiaensis]|uniref:PQQ-dependent sugar dehydrogenase n=1 Tax=Rubrolithibacter danxiaensis TaxID=3390805 RepID=UPI003BF80E20